MAILKVNIEKEAKPWGTKVDELDVGEYQIFSPDAKVLFRKGTKDPTKMMGNLQFTIGYPTSATLLEVWMRHTALDEHYEEFKELQEVHDDMYVNFKPNHVLVVREGKGKEKYGSIVEKKE